MMCSFSVLSQAGRKDVRRQCAWIFREPRLGAEDTAQGQLFAHAKLNLRALTQPEKEAAENQRMCIERYTKQLAALTHCLYFTPETDTSEISLRYDLHICHWIES
jgi:hypothetical protein